MVAAADAEAEMKVFCKNCKWFVQEHYDSHNVRTLLYERCEMRPFIDCIDGKEVWTGYRMCYQGNIHFNCRDYEAKETGDADTTHTNK